MKSSYSINCLAAVFSLLMSMPTSYAATDNNNALTAAQEEKLSRIVHDKLLAGPSGGNPKADVTVIEFFDYQCRYCREVAQNIPALIKADPNVRVVFKDTPIYRDRSEFAARAALAAHQQGKYVDLNLALMQASMPLTEETILNTAKSVGLDMKKLQTAMDDPDLKQQLQSNMQLASILNLPGTPAFVVIKTSGADKGKMVLVPGAINLTDLKKIIASIRQGEAE